MTSDNSRAEAIERLNGLLDLLRFDVTNDNQFPGRVGNEIVVELADIRNLDRLEFLDLLLDGVGTGADIHGGTHDGEGPVYLCGHNGSASPAAYLFPSPQIPLDAAIADWEAGLSPRAPIHQDTGRPLSGAPAPVELPGDLEEGLRQLGYID